MYFKSYQLYFKHENAIRKYISCTYCHLLYANEWNTGNLWLNNMHSSKTVIVTSKKNIKSVISLVKHISFWWLPLCGILLLFCISAISCLSGWSNARRQCNVTSSSYYMTSLVTLGHFVNWKDKKQTFVLKDLVSIVKLGLPADTPIPSNIKH